MEALDFSAAQGKGDASHCPKEVVDSLKNLEKCFLGVIFSFSGDIQDLPGQDPVQPALGDPVSAGGVGLDDPQTSLSTPKIL